MEMEIVSGEKGGIGEVIQALEQATLMAKQLPMTADSSQFQQIYSSLQSAHHHLSLFLSQSHPPPENSVSSAVAGEPMQLGDEEDDVNETEQNSKTSVDRVEERMRDCFIQNKRPKRPLSPVSAAGYDNDAPHFEYDLHATKLRSLDLIYQFHS